LQSFYSTSQILGWFLRIPLSWGSGHFGSTNVHSSTSEATRPYWGWGNSSWHAAAAAAANNITLQKGDCAARASREEDTQHYFGLDSGRERVHDGHEKATPMIASSSRRESRASTQMASIECSRNDMHTGILVCTRPNENMDECATLFVSTQTVEKKREIFFAPTLGPNRPSEAIQDPTHLFRPQNGTTWWRLF